MGVNLKLINVLNKYLLKDIKIGFTFLNTVNNKNLFLRLKKEKHLTGTINLIQCFIIKFRMVLLNWLNQKKNHI